MVMQRVIREEFLGRTIIAIAHQLDTIVDFDRVLVMDAGRLVESGSPIDLMRREGSAFKRLCDVQGIRAEV
jgi:ATP-binding cassette subfamily C (CFTR/MRP) protein 1